MRRINIICQHSAIIIIVFLMVLTAGRAAVAGQWSVYVAPERFTWREFDAGNRVVMESGPLVALGFVYLREFDGRMTVKPSAEIFFGEVDYDGQTQDGTPAASDVSYFGFTVKGDLGFIRQTSSRLFVEPFAGVGLDAWSRDINDGTDVTGRPTAGYVEDWLAFYGRAGARAALSLSAGKRVFAETGVKVPFYNENTARVSDIGLGSDITFHPGKKASFFAEAGAEGDRLKASLFYDGLRFSRSSDETNGFIIGHQPESTKDVYGFRLGYEF